MTFHKQKPFALLLFVTFGSICMLGQRQYADKSSEDKDMREIAAYKLTSNGLDKYQQVCKASSQLSKTEDDDKDTKSTESGWVPMDQVVQSLQKHPEVAKAIANGGLTPREFTLMTYTMLVNGAALATKQMGSQKPVPGTSPANIAFMESHQSEIEQIRKTCEERKREESNKSESNESAPQ